MSSIFKFDIKKLNSLLEKNRIRNTWTTLLATHLSQNEHLKYILQEKEVIGPKILTFNLLECLSIGEVSILYEYSVAYENSKARKLNGQYFTPDDVAKFMVSYSDKFGDGVWLDPCSGIGNLTWHLVSVQSNPEEFLKHKVIVSDKDELALLIARTLLTVSFQRSHINLFHENEKNFICFDFLSVADSGERNLFSGVEDLLSIPKHDFVIVNPPYLACKADNRFETSKAGDLYSYFLENIIKSSRGFISITPQSFTNARKFKSLRELLLANYNNLKIFTFDNVPANIFKGIKFGSTNSNQANSIRAAIIIALPGKGKPRITSLLRWRTSERDYLFKNIEKFLSDVTLTEEFFPKVSKEYKNLYSEMYRLNTLKSILLPKRTKYPLYIPSAPRYFIPALKKPAKRASQKVLYFPDEEKRDYAYMAINSSLLYWWWRVREDRKSVV
jgi:hypothetical protein